MMMESVSYTIIDRPDLPALPKDWQWVKFSDICDRVSVGHVGPTTEYFTNAEDGIRFLRSQNVRPGKLELETAVSITQDFHKKLKKSQLRSGDILFVRVGANRGDCCVVPDGIGELNCANIVFARPKHPTGFHAYFFQSELGQYLLLSASVGAAQGVINTSSVAAMPVPLPPLSIQHRIAGILSAYDELIENNQRRIRILEDMARSLYREWFVHFRYPGHESVPLVDSALGQIPQGWEVRKLNEIAENFDRLRKPLSKMQRAGIQGEYPYYGAAKVFDYINDYIFDGEYLLMAEDGSVITTERAPVLQLVSEKFWPNNHTHVLRGKQPYSTHFLYLGLSDVDISPYITGAAQPKITQENMNRIPFFCGPDLLHQEFNRLVESLIRQSQMLQRQTANLRRTRDLLLPRLLSGQIDVEATETSIEEAIA